MEMRDRRKLPFFEFCILEAADNLYSAMSWVDSLHFDNCAEHINNAAGIIEALETYLCGSVGGYAPGQSSNTEGVKYEDKYHNIFARWLFLYELKFGKNKPSTKLRYYTLGNLMKLYRRKDR